MKEEECMENAVAVRQEPFNEKSVLEYLALTGNKQKLLPDESAHFLNIAREFGLNPFKREIYITAFGEGQYRQCSIIVGYEVYLKRAERSGKLSGWKAWTEGSGKDLKAVIEIHRKDWEMPFVHEVFYEEACQRKKDGMPNQFWAKQPRFMTKKVAIAQGMRLCFSDELGGIPYTTDEVSEMEMHNVTPPVPAAGELASAALPAKPKGDPERERLLALIGEVAETKYLGVPVFPEEDKEEFRNLIREGKTPLPDLLATVEILARDRIAKMQSDDFGWQSDAAAATEPVAAE
ncbi:hypothetical protein FACS1894164_12070 [Spirochaetia bacterium]|nr:hypothetical protein FACS1894164_12070 [Spirochaetia bacterium]